MSPQVQQIDRAKVIGKKELRELTSLSYPTWWRLEKKCLAPARIRLSAGRVGWNAGAVLDWISSRETIHS